eukprot:scaffold12631_cov133-Skeletonema_marinoi.AAC.6
MDLQAILDASSSSSSEGYKIPLAAPPQQQQQQQRENCPINPNHNNDGTNKSISSHDITTTSKDSSSTSASAVSEISEAPPLNFHYFSQEMMQMEEEDHNDLMELMDDGITALLQSDEEDDDSSSDEVMSRILKSYQKSSPSKKSGGNRNIGAAVGGGANLELERILMEADDDDDEDDFSDNDNVEMDNNDDDDILMTTDMQQQTKKMESSRMKSSTQKYVSSRISSGSTSSRGGQEMNILHSILNEDDDEEDIEDYREEEDGNDNDVLSSMMKMKNSTTNNNDSTMMSAADESSLMSLRYHQQQPTTIQLSHSMEVDAILRSYDEEDDSNNDENENDTYNHNDINLHDDAIGSITRFTTPKNYSNRNLMVETEDSEASFGLNLNFSSSSNAKRNFSSTKSNIEAIEENISMQFPLRRENKSGGNNNLSSIGKDIFVNRRGDSSSSFLKDCTANFLQRVRSKDEGDETVDGGGEVGGKKTVQVINPPKEERGGDEQSIISSRCLHQAQVSEQRLLKPNNRNIVSPLTVKRRMKPKVELLTKSRKTSSSSSQFTPQRSNQQQKDQPRFGFSGVIQSKSMIALGPKDDSTKNPAGLPTALAFSSKFIAVGTQRGVIKIYDFYEQLKLSLGEDRNILAVTGVACTGGKSAGDEWASLTGSVTSIDLSPNGDYLLAGYGTGKIILWDIIKGSILNSTLDLHSSSISSVRLNALPMAAMGGRQSEKKEIGAVSVDANGIVNKLTFTKGMLWSTYSVETELLLDGTAGQILAMDSLPSFDDESGGTATMDNMDYHPSVNKIVLIALSSARSSFAISVVPKVNVLHRWAGPALDRIDPSIEIPKVEEEDDKSSIASSNYASSYATSYASTNYASSYATSYASSYATSYASTNYASTYISTSTYQTTENRKKEVQNKGPELPFLPILSWGWALVSGGGHAVSPILARAWGCSLQFLRASFPPRDENDDGDDGVIHNPAFGLHDEFDASSPVVALNWLGKRSLVYLTMTNEFTLIDTVIMTMQERLDFSGMKLVYAEFALSSSNSQLSGAAARTTFMNSIRSNDNRLLILCQEGIKQITVMGMREQIKSLEDGGQWLEALALALDHYESSISSQEDRRRSPTSMRHAGTMTSSSLTEDEIWMAELLMRYLTLAIDNAPESSQLEISYASSKASSQMNFAQSHFEMLSGVCIEFSVVTRRLDLLFGPIFRCFYEARFINVFLDVMETYVLNDKLTYIAPEAMVMFVAHCRDMKELSMVERCLLHMDCSLMDFDSILTLLKKNSLYTGLLHVYSSGLDDYVSPLEILFDAIFESVDESEGIHAERRSDGAPKSKFEQYGYKALLYLKYCFEGKSFPKGSALAPEERVQTLRQELFTFLLTEIASPPRPSANMPHRPVSRGVRSLPYPYLRVLILIDAKAFLDCLAIVLDDPAAQFLENARESHLAVDYAPDMLLEREHSDESGLEISGLNNGKLPNRQRIVDTLSSIIMADLSSEITSSFRHSDSKKQFMLLSIKAKDAFLDFLPKYLKLGVVQTSTSLTTEIFKRMCSKSGSSESEIVSLLQALPRSSYELDEVLRTIEQAKSTRGSLFLHKVGVSMTLDRPDMSDKCQHHFNRSIDCYLIDKDEEFRKGVFAYAMKECSSGNSNEASSSSRYFRGIVLRRLPELIKLDADHAAQLVGEMFVGKLNMIISSLEKMDSGRVAYSFLDAVISDKLNKMDTVASQELLANLTSNHHHKYLTLMANFQPDRVYQYLSTNQSYRLKDALELCQKRKIADASAYLLERMGDVSGALQLMLQTLDTRLVTLRNIFLENDAKCQSFGSRRAFNTKLSTLQNEVTEKEKNSLKQILSAVLDLCERNKNDHVTLENERGPLLWFHVLDRLVNAKSMLRDPKDSSQHLSASISTMLSELLLMTMQRMMPNVSLYDLLHKITKDHAQSDLGEFREMLVSMLKTYSSELDVCSNAVDVMYHDISHMSMEKKRLKVQGSLVQECPEHTTNHAVVTVTPSGKWEAVNQGNALGTQPGSRRMSARHAASVLKNRRRKHSSAMKRGIGGGSGGNGGKLSLMTAFEGESSMMDSDHHLVGCLSDAQHVGGFY